MPGAVEFKSRRECLLLRHTDGTDSTTFDNLGVFLHLSPDRWSEILIRFGGEHILVQLSVDEHNNATILNCGSYHPRPKSVSSNDYKEGEQCFEFYHLLPIPLSSHHHITELLSRDNYYLQNTSELREIVKDWRITQ